MDSENTRAASETQTDSADKSISSPAPIRPPGYIALWIITILSLLLNVVILLQFVMVRQVALQAIDDAIAMVDSLQNTTLTYTARVDDTVPINADLELSESIPVPINETLPINANVNVPVRIGPFGTYNVTVPISGSVPVNTTLSIVIDQPLHVSTTVPIHLEIPIQVAIKDTPLADTLGDVKTRLEALRLRMDRPLASFGENAPQPTPTGTPPSAP
jgi:hypothetical protein